MKQIRDAIRACQEDGLVGDLIGMVCLILMMIGTMFAGVILAPGAL